MNFLDILPYAVFLAILCLALGFWLSLPPNAPYAPPQSFIDALPSWLQGPRRRISTVKDEPVSAKLLADIEASFEKRLRMQTAPLKISDDEQREATSGEGVHEDVHGESEVVHDEP